MNLELPSFLPDRRFPGGVIPTIAGAWWRPAPSAPIGTIPVKISTTQGDQLMVHQDSAIDQSVQQSSVHRQVILLHGLGGCHGSNYMVRMTNRLIERGYQTWRLDARGCGAGLLLSKFHHHAGRIEDLQAVVDHVGTQYPESPITILGYSLGANLTLRWLSDDQVRTGNVDSAITVAPPIDLARCSEHLKTGRGRIFDRHFANMLMQRVHEKRSLKPDMADIEFPRKPENLAQFDTWFTAPLGGFDSLSHYQSHASSANRMEAITIPTAIIVDQLDPVVPIDMFQDEKIPPNVKLVLTKGGGHLGYLSRSSRDPDRHWLDWRLLDVVESLDRQER